MLSLIERFYNLPMPIKIGMAAVAGTSLAGVAYMMFSGMFVLILIIGLAVVAALVVAYLWLLRKWRQRQAKPFEKGVSDAGGATPEGVRDASDRARLDDLRRQFDDGVAKFRSAGKDLYSLPWYALVGEPGSGKTEAIRHCNVGFPPGLHDHLQGAGGTINMNWWFTNHAVILDTAGRLMFEEVRPGATNEWTEFLKLLVKNRRNCPINGMLLVIPADSLIKDSADEIERKAGQIAQQLDHIQRVLEVRFPVFVIVTKSDLITGFREFFEDLDDPRYQSQILGWSNPASLDEPFEPGQVEQHVASVCDQLRRRRQAMLIDPVREQNADETRDVDAMFAFPESFNGIGPRLRRYMEMIFVAGEWSAKPLFLRGIYFTSSMQEGAALDEAVAEALGMDVGSLPQGTESKTERSYFLRDLFIEKVFRERGLVTRASSARQLQRRRRGILLGAGFAGVLLLGLLTWLGMRSLEANIGGQSRFWTAVAREVPVGRPAQWAIVSQSEPDEPVQYRDGQQEALDIQYGGESLTLPELPHATQEMASRNVHVPAIFRLVSGLSGNLLRGERWQAHRRLLEDVIVLRPVVTAARRKLAAETPETWTPHATAALAQLLRLESAEAGMAEQFISLASDTDESAEAASPSSIRIDPLMAYLLDSEAYGRFRDQRRASGKTDRQLLAATLAATYSPTTADAAVPEAWPPSGVAAGHDAALNAVEHGLDCFADYWLGARHADAGDSQFAVLIQLRDALQAFDQQEQRVIELLDMDQPPATRDEHDRLKASWQRSIASLAEHKQTIDQRLAQMNELGIGLESNRSVEDVADRVRESVTERMEHDCALLRDQLPSEMEDHQYTDSRLRDLRAQLLETCERLRHELGNEVDAVASDLESLESDMLAPIALLQEREDLPDRPYAARFAMYHAADTAFEHEPSIDTLVQVVGDLSQIEQSLKHANAQVDQLAGFGRSNEKLTAAAGAARFVIAMAGREHHTDVLAAALTLVPQDASGMERLIEERSREPIPKPVIPYSVDSVQSDDDDASPAVFDPRFAPASAKQAFDAMAGLGHLVESVQSGEGEIADSPRVLDFAKLAEAYRQQAGPAATAYSEQYLRYWSDQVLNEAHLQPFNDWSSYRDALRNLRARTVNAGLRRLYEQAIEAVKQMPSGLVDPTRRTQAIQQLERKLSLVETRKYDRACDDVLGRWVSLEGNAAAALLRLLEMNAETFKRDYLELYHEDPDEVAEPRYWSQIAQRGLETLADHAEVDAREAKHRLIGEFKRFPLSRDAPYEDGAALDHASLARAHALAQKIHLPTRQQSGTATLRADAPTGLETVDELVARARGETVLGRSAERKWFRSARRVLESLGGDTPVRVHLFVPPEARIDPPEWPYVEVWRGEERVADLRTRGSDNWVRVDDGQGEPVVFTLPSDAPLELRFYRRVTNESGELEREFAQPITFPAPWTLLTLMLSDEPGGDGALDDASMRRLPAIPLQWSDANGEMQRAAVELRMELTNATLPELAQWPASANWPSAEEAGPLTRDPMEGDR